MCSQRLGSLVIFSLILLFGCVVSPDRLAEATPFSASAAGDRMLIRGRTERNGVEWTAVVVSEGEGKPSVFIPRSYEDGISRHHSQFQNDENILAILNGSPHYPVRFRSGRRQAVAGFFRLNGNTYSPPNGRHDALGIGAGKNLVILGPEEQSDWPGDAVGGFYRVLVDGEPVSIVDVEDAVAAVGWNEDTSTVVFLATEGRPGKGVRYAEAASILGSLGADTGLAMDGGGSVRLSWREGDTWRDFPPNRFYRAVPNGLAVGQY